ncbi:DNA excision repair protein Rad2 [Morchella snyderi]|nr:DNA excision repair protein Rad2 [Morchella snyderi]
MGVTGLWTIIQPCARPIKLETLARKRLAVDASIWIYQFLKAVRDREGNALRNSHIVGFFRRICKLLFHGVRPVFVFDGGAPALKRQTIAGRKSRREGRKEDARRTAGRILALQVQREADRENERRKKKAKDREEGWADVTHHGEEGEEAIPKDVVYVDELMQTPEQIKKNRQVGFRKTDPYHLPDLDTSMENMGQPNDPRIMSTEELEEYACQFRGGEEMSLYDFSKIDFDSPFFCSLPPADRYNILNAARLRSRLRMGLSKEQLDAMFPNRLDFSKFQIERVRERNELTQRLMNLNGANEVNTLDISRVAGERGREYVLVRNDGVEGGWALGVVGQKGDREGEQARPIVVDTTAKLEEDDPMDDDEDDFEDVPIEGLNRLPKIHVGWDKEEGSEDERDEAFNPFEDPEAQMLRRAIYESRKEAFGSGNSRSKILGKGKSPATMSHTPNPLFLGGDEEEDDDDYYSNPLLAQKHTSNTLSDEEEEYGQYPHDDEVLQEAIRMSLAVPSSSSSSHHISNDDFSTNDIFIGRDLSDIAEEEEEDEEEEEEEESDDDDDDDSMIGKGKGIAVERRYIRRELVPILPKPADDGDDDLRKALEESRRMQNMKPSDSGYNKPGQGSGASATIAASSSMAPASTSSDPFGGLLPFESLDLSKSKSLLTKKKEPEKKECGREDPDEPSLPLPPWFVGETRDLKEEMQKANREKEEYIREKRLDDERIKMEKEERQRQEKEILGKQREDAVLVESSDEDDLMVLDFPTNGKSGMSDMADKARAVPPKTIPEQASSRKGGESAVGTGEAQGNDGEENSDHEEAVAKPSATSTHDVARPNSAMTPGNSPPPPDLEEPDFRDVTPPFEDEESVYSDPEEDAELFQSLAAETEEHARFAAELNNKSQEQVREEYERELKSLRAQQAKDRRDADEVTQVMIQECQQLLKLFGIPYITAPMEAEAQCAELVNLGLVDGIVTDDSDTFLFGGTRVYKNMFNQAKFVECYLASDLEKEFSLDRRSLIRIAHLLGSDYTEGLPSVGPVTALELLVEFSGEDGLVKFRDWWASVQQGTSKPADDATNKFKKKFRKNVTKIFLPPSFPATEVDEAYLNPEVDKDPSPFEWGVPDLEGLRDFLMATIGWSQEHTDEVLVPVIRDMNSKQAEGTQSNITQFFDGNTGTGAFAPRRRAENKSKRLESAMLSLHEQAVRKRKGQEEGESGEDNDGEEEAMEPKPKRQKRAKPKAKPKAKRKNTADEDEDGYRDDGEGGVVENAPKRRRRAAKI